MKVNNNFNYKLKSENRFNKFELLKKLLIVLLLILVNLNYGCKRDSIEEKEINKIKDDKFYSDSSHSKMSSSDIKSDEGIIHVVSKGETLNTIKEIYGISIPTLKKYNPDLSENKSLKVGQNIFIPGSKTLLTSRRDNYFKNKNLPNTKNITNENNNYKFEWPVKGTVISNFSNESKGIIIKIPKNTPVYAIDHGEVVFSGNMKGYGNLIIIDHLNGFFSIYGYNSKNLVKKGDTVKLKDKIALGDNKENAKFYFELRTINPKTNEPESVDPLNYLK